MVDEGKVDTAVAARKAGWHEECLADPFMCVSGQLEAAADRPGSIPSQLSTQARVSVEVSASANVSGGGSAG